MTIPSESPTQVPNTAIVRAPLWEPYFVRVLLSHFLFGLGFSTYFVLPKFLIEELAADPTLVGNAHGVFALATVLSVPLVSYALRRFGYRSVWLGGLLASAAGFSAFAFVSDATEVLLLRSLHGLTFGLVFSAGTTLVVDRTPASRRGEAIGYFGTALIVTNAFGPALAETIAHLWGWGRVFLLSGAYVFLSWLNAARLRLPVRGQQLVEAGRTLPSRGTLYWALVAVLAMGVGVGTSKAFVPGILVAEGGHSTVPHFLAYTAGALVQRVLLGRLPDRIGHHRATSLALAGYALALGAVAAAPVELITPLAFFVGLAHGLLYPAVSAWVMGLVAPEVRGSVTAWTTGIFNGGFALSASGLPLLAAAWGYRGLVLAGACLLGAAAIAVPLGPMTKAWAAK